MPISGGMAALGGGAATSLIVHLIAKDKFSKVFSKAEGKMGKFRLGLNKLGAAGLTAGAGIAVGIGIKAVTAAAAFEKGMSNVSTLVDTSTESMEDMGKKVKDISRRIPVDLSELTTALYDVRSAGIDAGDAMKVLESSGKLAVAGLGTTQEATNLLTSSMNVFSKQGYDSEAMANILFKTVKAGKTTVAELAQSFGMVAPLAGALNVSFPELQAATAALTTTGMKASVAQSQLRAGMSNLMKPTAEMRELMDKVGVSTAEELIQTYGLVGGLGKLKEASEGNTEQYAKAMGSIEGLNAALFLTSDEGGQAFLDVQKDMLSGTDDLTVAFGKQTESADAQFKLLKNQFNVVMADLGAKILPVAIEVMKKVPGIIDAWMDGFAKVIGFVWDVRDAFTAMGEAIGKVGKKAGEIGGAVGGFFTGGRRGEANIPWVPFLQKGGVVPGPVGRPTPIIAHGGETVIPTKGGVGNVFNFDFSGAFIGDIETFKREIMDLINRESELKTLGGE